ncbi:MAG: TolC family protein [Sulfuricaulis sp.]
MPYRHVILAASLCLGSVVSTALPAETINLEQAVSYSLEHNPDLLAVREQISASGARTRAAKGARLPSLGLSTSASASDNPLDAFANKLNARQVTAPDFDPAHLNHPGTSDLYMTQLALRLPVYTGGRLSATVKSAEDMEQNSRLQYARAREITAFQTICDYLNVQAAQEGLAIAEEAVAAARKHAQTTAQLARAGRIVVSDKLTAEVNLAAVQSSRDQAVTRLESAHNRLKLIMGMPLDSDITLASTGFNAIGDDASLTELEARALANRKDLAAARALNQAATARVQATRAAYMPNVDLIASSNWYDNKPGFDNHSSSIMGVIRLELYAGGQHESEISAALAEDQEMQWRVQALEQSAQDDVREAYDGLREAQARHATAADNVERARANVRLVEQRYGQGRTILIDLLQAERAYTDARLEELGSRLNQDIGQASLQLADGTLVLPPESAP